ncbi:hypothetical protein BD779DRAFT_1590374 [Infundibulicybe gibba]|nr:hypothetical protein BD779DRAFT_1590374 [Infundibulicybe gibba]
MSRHGDRHMQVLVHTAPLSTHASLSRTHLHPQAARDDARLTVNALAAAGNVLIAATLCTLLHRSRTGFRRSDTMINKLILFAVNTGFLTSLCAVASLILIIVAGDTFLYIAFFFCIGRLYSNTLLATLNVRKMIRGAAEGVNTTSENVSLSLSEFPKAGTVNSTRPTNVSININTTQEFTTDSDQDHEGKKIGSAISTGSVVECPFKEECCQAV